MALAHAIMTALIDDEMSGYELAKSFDRSLGVFWQASHQQIYQELRKLAQKKLLRSKTVSQPGRPDKISYGLTAAGRRALASWVMEETRRPVSKDELFVRLYSVGTANVAHISAELERRREEVMQRLYLYEAIRRRHYADPQQLPDRRKGVYLALRAGILQGEQFLQWCDEALALLGTVEGA